MWQISEQCWGYLYFCWSHLSVLGWQVSGCLSPAPLSSTDCPNSQAATLHLPTNIFSSDLDLSSLIGSRLLWRVDLTSYWSQIIINERITEKLLFQLVNVGRHIQLVKSFWGQAGCIAISLIMFWHFPSHLYLKIVRNLKIICTWKIIMIKIDWRKGFRETW